MVEGVPAVIEQAAAVSAPSTEQPACSARYCEAGAAWQVGAYYACSRHLLAMVWEATYQGKAALVTRIERGG